MGDATIFDLGIGYIIVLAMSSLRIAVAFLITPLFTDELVPPLIKTSLFVALGIIVTTVHPTIDVESFSSLQWIMLFAKEAFIGLAVGFFFGIFLWAFESAGVIVDTQIGAAMSMVYDPITGHETTLYGELISRWIHFLFVAAGGLLFLTMAVLESYVIWPMDQFIPDFQRASVVFFQEEFGRFASLILMIAAPIIIVVFMVDASLGLINRFAKRLDIVFISMAIKNLVGLLMVLIMIPIMANVLFRQLDIHNEALWDTLNQILGVAG